MTMPNRPIGPGPEQPGLASVRCGLYRVGREGAGAAGLVGQGDEVVLWVEVRAGWRARELVVELWRGDRLRDRGRLRLRRGVSVSRLWRLRWGEAGGSSRLTCRVLVDGREVARRAALLGPGAVDAQGRFAGGAPARGASPATLLAFTDELRRRLSLPDGRRENGRPRHR
jgi:hypothetical protein